MQRSIRTNELGELIDVIVNGAYLVPHGRSHNSDEPLPANDQNVLNELEPGVYRAAGYGRFEHLGVDIQERRLSENRGRFVNVIIVIIGERAQWLIAFLHRDRRRCGQDLPQQIERAGEVGPMRESSVPLRGGPKNRGGSIEGDTDAPPPACSRRAGGVSPRVRL